MQYLGALFLFKADEKLRFLIRGILNKGKKSVFWGLVDKEIGN